MTKKSYKVSMCKYFTRVINDMLLSIYIFTFSYLLLTNRKALADLVSGNIFYSGLSVCSSCIPTIIAWEYLIPGTWNPGSVLLISAIWVTYCFQHNLEGDVYG